MKKCWVIAVVVLSSIGFTTMTKAETFPTDAEIRAILQQRIDQEKQSPGIVVGVIDPTGRRIISYGSLSQGDSRPVDGNTLFEIGSISKVFTAIALVQLVEQGKLNLEDPISKFLPASVKSPTWKGKEITLLDLATHTSGLPRLPDNFNPADMDNPYVDYGVEQLYAFLSSYQLTRERGAQYEYSNLGAGLLGHILSLKTGMTYENLVKAQIAQPLQMNDTTIQISSEQQTRFATGHNAVGRPVSYWDLPTLAGAGALRSTATDMLKFLAANLELTPSPMIATLQKTHKGQKQTDTPKVTIALGWHILDYNRTEIITHSGGTGGFRSFAGFIKQKQMGVIVLSNSANDIEDIGLHLLDRQIPLPKLPKQRQAIAVDPKLFAAYVGQYELAPNFILSITQAQNRLYLQATGQPKVELFAETATQFFITEVDAQVTFVRGSQGTVNQLILHQNGKNLPAKKLSSP